MMNSMLQQTLIIGTARKADLPGWEAAGKTGTSQDYRDAWFVGYTSQLTTGVWLGNDDNSPTKKASGANLPVDIWSKYMREALKGQVVAGLPTGGWRSESLNMGLPASLWPQPEAQQQPAPQQAVQHLDTSNPGAPIVFSGAGRAPQPAQRQAPPPQVERQPQFDRDEEPVPPGDIPEGRPTRQARDDRNFLEKLFGGE
jgi:penicillin-binding protein 1A